MARQAIYVRNKHLAEHCFPGFGQLLSKQIIEITNLDTIH